jgi:hypothetical protein
MKKSIYLAIIFVVSINYSGYSQVEWSVKAGGGTSWVIFPKVFLVDPTNVNNIWEIGPSTNSGTFYLSGEVIIPMNDHWFAAPGVSYNYTSGRIKVTSVELATSSTKLQSYSRIELPLLFGVKAIDDFWVTFGPSVFFNIADNEGLKQAIDDLADASNVNTTRKVGIKAHVGLGITLSERLFIEVNFDSDFGKRFEYIDYTYEIRLSMQSVSVGFGWVLN